MRVENWNAKGVFEGIKELALVGANDVMDSHAADARRRCPVGTVTRPDGYVNRLVSFTPKTDSKGRLIRESKRKPVSFTAKTWIGREPGSLRATIRKVTKHDRPGNIRCYAGTNRVFYARFVEYGTSRTQAHPFLRPSFHAIKGNAEERIAAEMKKHPEVR